MDKVRLVEMTHHRLGGREGELAGRERGSEGEHAMYGEPGRERAGREGRESEGGREGGRESTRCMGNQVGLELSVITP